MPWISNEDLALKKKLQGITVQDANNPNRPVPVRYRLPEDELATLSYPIIIIEHLGLFPAPEREHSGEIQLSSPPEIMTTGGASMWTQYPQWWPANSDRVDISDSPYYAWYPTPYNFDYQVTVYARKMAGHLQNIMAVLASSYYIPHHFGWLNVANDQTQRKLWLMGGPELEYGKDNNDKRLFRAKYRVRVESELILTPGFTVNGPFGQLVTQIDVDLGCYSDVTDIDTEEVSANFGVITSGPSIQWNVEGFMEPVGTYPEGNIQPLPTFLPRRKTSRAITKGTSVNQTLNKIHPEE